MGKIMNYDDSRPDQVWPDSPQSVNSYRNQNLKNFSFRGKNLANTDFSYSDLRGCDFSDADLSNANFTGVITGQTSRQLLRQLGCAVLGAIVLIIIAFACAHLAEALGLDQVGFERLIGFFSLLFWIFSQSIRNAVEVRWPGLTLILNMAAVSLLIMMGLLFSLFSLSFTLTGNALGPLSGFTGWAVMGVIAPLLIAVIAAFWLHRLMQEIPGTLFRSTNLTGANFSNAQLQNANFLRATLTGICVFNWQLGSQNCWTDSACEYLFLGENYSDREPERAQFTPIAWSQHCDRLAKPHQST
ncbi:hypothetical protein AMR42_02290 [Limnothrix sp. PR1529]|uniref:pentapeptide repeat-containing protein n=1 Tax=Limnothrix sp. PR1529 TaxID=1704291 RepID=UPI00081F44C4|nr:pentapeptide repeat-containing protein [Limnothrix sp. PR1529]OCQ95436.1 hypothetical protein BCR12_18330 [Limnothrix sp. P13C2]PIB15139.1 hypothetical protein AMR42_02290 [Limnothrix sp. PR1529]